MRDAGRPAYAAIYLSSRPEALATLGCNPTAASGHNLRNDCAQAVPSVAATKSRGTRKGPLLARCLLLEGHRSFRGSTQALPRRLFWVDGSTINPDNYLILLVGAGRFELPTPSPPDWCANQAALRSDP